MVVKRVGCTTVAQAGLSVASFWSGSVRHFLQSTDDTILGTLAAAQIRHHRTNDKQQLRAWEDTITLLRTALDGDAHAGAWHLLLEYPMLRLGRRADAILLTDSAVIVLEIKAGAAAFSNADCEQAEDYALDLADFHAGCRTFPIFPVLVATQAPSRPFVTPLPLAGVTSVIPANADTLRGVLKALVALAPERAVPLDPAIWMAAPYRPVPTIVEAACMLYARHGVADIAAARAGSDNLGRTTDAILAAIAAARMAQQRLILFVTGIPGAGKTLCGLNAAFGGADAARATFLTGNPTLVHVLREALARDARDHGANLRAARQQMEGAIQALPRFRDHHVATGEIPAEQIVVVDEAQRCWARDHAIAKTRDRPVRLTDSEPGHLLEIMARHPGFAAMICLVGHGQEIHDGEGGLAEWGDALRAAPGWHVAAPPDLLAATDPRQRIGELPDLSILPALHLDVPIRQIRSRDAALWVDHVLAGRAAEARLVADRAHGVPFLVTRSLPNMRAWLRSAARGNRRCGLLASSGGKRLRAEGLGVELPHMDAKAVARWFLDRWPDVRASDALEVVATEFSCQGLELDYAGLCWDGDLIRLPGNTAWRVRSFRGSIWTTPTGAEAIANQVNTYRVLLTRARYETMIFVPPGDPIDPTRSPSVLNGIADFLRACGAEDLQPIIPLPEPAPEMLLL
jgi:hypothetical protein